MKNFYEPDVNKKVKEVKNIVNESKLKPKKDKKVKEAGIKKY